MARPIVHNIQNRRGFLKCAPAIGASAVIVGARTRAATQDRARVIEEDDPGNIKLARRLPAEISDQDLLFLKQIVP